VKKDYITTFRELLNRYIENYQHQSSFQTMKRFFLENFRAYFGEDTRLANIRYVDLETYRNYFQRKVTKSGTIRAVATVNREIACLRHLFSKAVEWEMVERNPFGACKTLLAKENNKRYRYLDQDEIDRLLESCVNDYTRDIVTAAINKGMRREELLGLKWEQIKGVLSISPRPRRVKQGRYP